MSNNDSQYWIGGDPFFVSAKVELFYEGLDREYLERKPEPMPMRAIIEELKNPKTQSKWNGVHPIDQIYQAFERLDDKAKADVARDAAVALYREGATIPEGMFDLAKDDMMRSVFAKPFDEIQNGSPEAKQFSAQVDILTDYFGRLESDTERHKTMEAAIWLFRANFHKVTHASNSTKLSRVQKNFEVKVENLMGKMPEAVAHHISGVKPAPAMDDALARYNRKKMLVPTR